MDARRARALEEPLDVRLRSDDPYPLLEVRNPLHRTSYLVMLPEYPERTSALCTCTDFARRGLGTCKHIEATLAWLAAHPPAPQAAPARRPGAGLARRWHRIDERLEALGRRPGSLRARMRSAGRMLYETPGR
ncbi:MAG TPA: hypothetical protein VEL82_01965 [Thermoplasmata archaeon]|nr:hypothetical protein [Thermoplasmata archaeon]